MTVTSVFYEEYLEIKFQIVHVSKTSGLWLE